MNTAHKTNHRLLFLVLTFSLYSCGKSVYKFQNQHTQHKEQIYLFKDGHFSHKIIGPVQVISSEGIYEASGDTILFHHNVLTRNVQFFKEMFPPDYNEIIVTKTPWENADNNAIQVQVMNGSEPLSLATVHFYDAEMRLLSGGETDFDGNALLREGIEVRYLEVEQAGTGKGMTTLSGPGSYLVDMVVVEADRGYVLNTDQPPTRSQFSYVRVVKKHGHLEYMDRDGVIRWYCKK